MSILYIIELADNPSIVKVGISSHLQTWNESRSASLRVGYRTKANKIYEIYNANKLERYILNHPKFRDIRIPGTEWFSFKTKTKKNYFLNLIKRQVRFAKYIYEKQPQDKRERFLEYMYCLNESWRPDYQQLTYNEEKLVTQYFYSEAWRRRTNHSRSILQKERHTIRAKKRKSRVLNIITPHYCDTKLRKKRDDDYINRERTPKELEQMERIREMMNAVGY